MSSWAKPTFVPDGNFDPSSRLTTTDMGRKLVTAWVRIQHHVARAESYHLVNWHRDPYSRLRMATLNMGRKVGAVPLFGPGSYPNCVPI